MAYISNKVRYYHSGMADAPVLSGTAGALIAVLDACLVNGFGHKNINSITVTDGIATAHISSGHTFGEGDVLRIAGVTGALAGLNDDWRLASVTADTVTWSVEGLSIPGGSATGTITCLRAPAGWEKMFSATNRAAYRSVRHAEHNGLILYVDDTGTTTARARGYEAMSSIDAGTGPFPTDAQQAGGLWWAKAHSTTGTRAWHIVADAQRVTVAPEYVNLNAGFAPGYCFGRLLYADDDLWATVISGADTSSNATNGAVSGSGTTGLLVSAASSASLVAAYIARNYTGVGAGAQVAAVNWGTTLSGSSAYPAGDLNTRITGASARIIESTQHVRGVFPGPTHSWWNMPLGTVPPRSVFGVPGQGAVVMRYSSAQQNTWLLDLGAAGRWG